VPVRVPLSYVAGGGRPYTRMDSMNRSGWKEPRAILMLVGMLLLAGIVTVAILRDRIVRADNWQVGVTGQAKVAYTPDTANINLGIQVEKTPKAEDALKQLNGTMNAVIAAIKKAGIGDQDIQTQNYTLSPYYEMVKERSELSGYTANQSLIVKVRDLDKNPDAPAKIIAAASGAGINQVNGIGFESSRILELKEEARLKALGDAKAKAGTLAATLGISLGKIVGWWENYVPVDYTNAGMYDGKGGMGGGGISDPSLPVGARELTVEVTVNYLIE
jgi:uncharacterized protein